MLNASSLKFFDELMRTSGPSGFEIPCAAVFRKRLEPFADELYVDVTGNSIAILNPDSPFRIMLAGHYDEIGFQVVYITDEGLVTFRAVGGIDKVTLPGLEVDILTATGKVPGVIGRKPIHLQTPKERETVMEINDLWIDIGAESRSEAEKLISIGDPVAFRVNYARFGKNRVMSKGLDDKIGAFVIAEAFRLLSERDCKLGVYAVGTVQEELGLRGAKTCSFAIDPQAAIAVDVGFATDVPGVEKKQWGDVTLGGGPIICRNADINPVLYSRLISAAKKGKIPVQIEAGHRASGGTDTAQIQLSRAGVATALVSIPNRYMHTPVEMCDLRDAENAAKLIADTISSLDEKTTFIPGIDGV